MSDDFLRDLEGQLRAAAERRRRRPVWIPRLAAAAVALGAIVAALAVAGTPDSERDVTPVGTEPTPAATPSSDCGSTALHEVAPALSLPRTAPAPAAVQRGEHDRGIGRDLARRVVYEDGVSYWVVPWLLCEDASLEQDEVCMVPVLDAWDPDEPGAPRVCATPSQLRRDGVSMTFPVAGGAAVAGLAPPGATAVELRSEGRAMTTLPVRDGAFGALVAPGADGLPAYDFEYVGEARPIAVLGPGAAEAARRLRDAGFLSAREFVSEVVPPDPRVYFTGRAGADLAREVESALGLPHGAIPAPERVRDELPDARVIVVTDPS